MKRKGVILATVAAIGLAIFLWNNATFNFHVVDVTPPSGNATTSSVIRMGPAPHGDPVAIGWTAIQMQQREACPAVREARRVADGSIRVVCTNDVIVRVMGIQGTSQLLALRCMPPADGNPPLC